MRFDEALKGILCRKVDHKMIPEKRKKMRRRGWVSGKYVFFDGASYDGSILLKTRKNGDIIGYSAPSYDMLSIDWELI